MLSFSFHSEEALVWIGLVVAADAMVHPAIVGPQKKVTLSLIDVTKKRGAFAGDIEWSLVLFLPPTL